MTYLVPLDDGLGVSDDGAEELDGVALLSHVAVEIVGRCLGGTWKSNREESNINCLPLPRYSGGTRRMRQSVRTNAVASDCVSVIAPCLSKQTN